MPTEATRPTDRPTSRVAERQQTSRSSGEAAEQKQQKPAERRQSAISPQGGLRQPQRAVPRSRFCLISTVYFP